MILDSLSVALDNKVLCLLRPNRQINVRKFEEEILMSLCTFAVHSWALCGSSQKGWSESRKSTKTFEDVLLTTVCTLNSSHVRKFSHTIHFINLENPLPWGSVKCSQGRTAPAGSGVLVTEFRAVCGVETLTEPLGAALGTHCLQWIWARII